MAQNINLITTLDIQPTSILSAKLIIQIVSGWVLLLILLYTTSFVSNSHKQKTLVNLNSIKKDLQTQMAAFNQELGKFNNTSTLQNLKNLPFSSTNVIGFYRYLESLATFTPRGIWLNELAFSQPDNLILLKGYATTSSEIPNFIKTLDKSNDFNDKIFGTLQLQKTPNSGNISFTLGTITATTEVEAKTKPNKTTK
jgi:hypothetical protein